MMRLVTYKKLNLPKINHVLLMLSFFPKTKSNNKNLRGFYEKIFIEKKNILRGYKREYYLQVLKVNNQK